MPVTVPVVVPIPVAVGRHPNMIKQFLLLFIAIMIFMVAFAYEDGTLADAPGNVRIEYHVARDGTWLAIPAPYKLPEKKQFWTMP